MRVSVRVLQLALLIAAIGGVIALAAMEEQWLGFTTAAAIGALVLSAYLPTHPAERGEIRLTFPEQLLAVFAIGCFGRELGPMIAITAIFLLLPLALISSGLRRWVNSAPPARSVDLILALAAVGSLAGCIGWIGASLLFRV